MKNGLPSKVTPENIGEILSAIPHMRETPGQEGAILSGIDELISQTKNLGLHEQVVRLYWEKFLTCQHVVMQEDKKEDVEIDGGLRNRMIDDMHWTASLADQYLDEQGLVGLKPDSYRNLGRAYTYKRDHVKAEGYYRKSLEGLEKTGNFRVLEVRGFIAYSLISQGKVDDGLQMAREVWGEYDEGMGLELKTKDYCVWAVWKSGVFVGMAKSLLETGTAQSYKEELSNLANKVNEILVFPNGQTTWADKSFGYQRDEVASIKRKLKLD